MNGDDWQLNEKDFQRGGGRKQMKLGTTRRNCRERNRVRHLNQCFEILRQHIPQEKHQKKLSKVDTLKSAMIYIQNLQLILDHSSSPSSSTSNYFHYSNHGQTLFPMAIKREEDEDEDEEQ